MIGSDPWVRKGLIIWVAQKGRGGEGGIDTDWSAQNAALLVDLLENIFSLSNQKLWKFVNTISHELKTV